MSVVIEVISGHLRENRRLVVPGFGAFMVKESGERLFSDLLRTDDGVLASLLRARGMNEMEAAVTIDRFIFEMRYDLEQYGYYRLGEVGTLRVEPSTKALRLYPPVQGEVPKHAPYVPQPIIDEEQEVNDESNLVEDKGVTPVAEVAATPISTPAAEKEVTNAPANPTTPKKAPILKPRRKKFDLVMVVAVVIVLAALVAIGYGVYVDSLAECDDAKMEELRVVPTSNE